MPPAREREKKKKKTLKKSVRKESEKLCVVRLYTGQNKNHMCKLFGNGYQLE